ncbi:uncharacterized protein DS421_20g693330 [Arachis hypogaea]|nr:uncharacterized protein DS421_20g693330 [Arachis hypogaea]
MKVARKLEEKMGKVLEVRLFEMKGKKEAQILKAKVMLNDKRPVKDSLKVQEPNQTFMEVGLRYEMIRIFCTYCGHLGHDSKSCLIFLRDSSNNFVKEDKVSEWLKADQMGRRVEIMGEPKEKKFNNTAKHDQHKRRNRLHHGCLKDLQTSI